MSYVYKEKRFGKWLFSLEHSSRMLQLGVGVTFDRHDRSAEVAMVAGPFGLAIWYGDTE